MSVTRVDQLSDEEKARLDEWADRWIEIGLRTGPADRARFESAVRDCYRHAGIEFPDVVVWVPSPMVLALAAPTAAFSIELIAALQRRSLPLKGDAVDDAVRGAVDDAVDGAVDGAVRGAVDGAVRDAVGDAVDGAVRGAVGNAVGNAVRGAVDDAVGNAVDDAVGAVFSAIGRSWYQIVGGQLWAGGWYWGGAFTSFFREICGLELPGDTWDRGRAYEGTIESACWWWPHRRFVMVCERPSEIHREPVDLARPRGFGSHRLHNDSGPAVSWPDGWGVWSVHGVRVTRQVVESPETLTVEQIRSEPNAEVRRVMMDRFGAERYLRESDAELVHEDECGKLWRVEVVDDEDLLMVEVLNSTPEPDGSTKTYWLRVPPDTETARAGVAWTFDVPEDLYLPAVQT